MISHLYKRLEESEKDLKATESAMEACWRINEYEMLQKKKAKLLKVIELNKSLYVQALQPVRHTKIKGFDNRCGQTNNGIH